MPIFPGTGPRSRVATVAAGVAATLVMTAAPAVAASWTVVASPNRNSFDNVLWGVDATGPARAWAVGFADTGTAPTRQPMIQRWNGAQWRIVASPALDHGGELRSVEALSDTFAWAVGSAGTDNGDVPLVERWNGVSWQRVKSPAVSTLNYLLDVRAFGPADAWSVGTANVPGTLAFQTLIQHFDGASWSVVPSPNPAPFENQFSAVDGSGPTDVWAVGHTRNGPDGVEQPLVAHFDGAAWTSVPTPPARAATLQDVVALSPTNAWAVGWAFSLELFSQVPYVLHWDGTGWRAVTLPALPGARLYGVAALAADRVYAMGESATASMIMRWNGTRWSVEATPNPPGARLYGADAVAPSTVWAVGVRGGAINRQTLTLRTTNG